MLIAIDGTGSGPWMMATPAGSLPSPEFSQYDREMKFSFVRQLVKDYINPQEAKYFRGPTLDGAECSTIALFCMMAAKPVLNAGGVVHLAGYSRGGAVAIEVARQIRNHFPAARIPVMALFDAVDRAYEFGHLAVVPGNVDIVFHALRDPVVQSREYFGNCGTRVEPPCKLEKLTFVTSHGGMGGMPLGSDRPMLERIRIVEAVGQHTEAMQSHLVHKWMWTNLRKSRVVR